MTNKEDSETSALLDSPKATTLPAESPRRTKRATSSNNIEQIRGTGEMQ